MCVGASVARESKAFGAGCASGTEAARAVLAVSKAAGGGGRPLQHLGVPSECTVRGWSVRAIPGRKRL
jgi:hypothetical protein